MSSNRAVSSGSARSRRMGSANVSIVGAGAVGSALSALLYKRGYRIASVVSRSMKPAQALARSVRCRTVSSSVADISPSTDILVLAVPDDELELLVPRIARVAKMQHGLVVHVSGVHSCDVLRPMQKRGAMIASLHPIQSFPKTMSLRDRTGNMIGIWFGIEGSGAALRKVRGLVRGLGGKPILIPEGKKPLYHAACVFASNYVLTLLNAVSEAFGAAGLKKGWKEIVTPLIATTLEQALRLSPQKALTGPVVRADVHTLALHVQALQSFAPQLIPLYTVMGIDTARVVRQAGRLAPHQFRSIVGNIRRSVRSYLKNKEPKEKR